MKDCASARESHSAMSDSLRPHGLYSPWNSPGQNTGVGSLSFLQGIFPTQGSNPGLPHCRQILYQPQGKPKNAGIGSLPLLQEIIPTQELNQGLLYQLSYQGSPQCRRTRFYPWVRKIPWRREWLPIPVLLPGGFYGQRSLVGCSPCGPKW